MITNEFTMQTRTYSALNAAICATFGYAELNLTLDAGLVAEAAKVQILSHIEPDVLSAILAYKAGNIPFLVLRNFKTDAFVGATPPTGFSSSNSCPRSMETLLGLHAACGMQPMSYAFENDGKLLRNVIPVETASGEQSSHGSDSAFPWHTDNPSSWPAPAVLSFIGVRNVEQVPTDILALDNVISALSPEALAMLSEPRYRHNAPASNEKYALPLLNSAVLSKTDGKWEIRYDGQSTEPMTVEDAAAYAGLASLRIAFLEAEAQGAVTSVILNKGDFLSFHNTRVLHRRKAFVPHQVHAKRRWLVRVYGVKTHDDLVHPAPEERPFVVA